MGRIIWGHHIILPIFTGGVMEHVAFSVGNEGRQVFWNAEYFEPILFFFTAIALVIFAYGVYRRWQLWVALG
jgi:hypothetical protein